MLNVHLYIWWVKFGDAKNISKNGSTITTSYFETVITTGFWAIIMKFWYTFVEHTFLDKVFFKHASKWNQKQWKICVKSVYTKQICIWLLGISTEISVYTTEGLFFLKTLVDLSFLPQILTSRK